MNRKQLKAEVIKCGRDPAYFIRNYVKIQHPVRGLLPFDLYEYQAELLESYEEHRFNVILKARQLGISEVTAAYATWLMLFRRDKNILVMATKKDTSKNIIRKVATAIRNLPPWLMLARVVTDNVFSIELSTGSRIKAVSSAKDAGRSEAVSLLIIDEAAHIDNMEEIWTGIRPTITTGGKVVVLSTPKGTGNMFHKTFVQAEANENDFFPTTLMWHLHPERVVNKEGIPDLEDDAMRPGFKTSSWFREETKGMDPREIAQELECNFNASGDNFIHSDYLDAIKNSTIDVPTSFDHIDRKIHIWAPPTRGTDYFISADVARGDASDYSACHVFRVSDMSQVAEYKGKIPTDKYAQLLVNLGIKYNGAMLAVENNNVGFACLEHIKLLEYENLYFSPKSQFDEGQSFNMALPMPDSAKYVPGYTTSPRTRPLILAKLEEYIRLGKIVVRSERLLEELRKFIWKNGRPEASVGSNDDLVMGAAIGCMLHNSHFASSYMTEEVSKIMLSQISYNTTDNSQIPGASKNPDFTKSNSRTVLERHNPYDLTLPDGSIENIGWLIGKG